MAILARLFRVSTLAGALGVYVPAMVLQKTVGFVRALIFMYLMKEALPQYSLWNVAMMIFCIASPVAALGVNNGLARYVSLYEAAGLLKDFYHAIRWKCLAAVLAITGVALAGSDIITRWVIVSDSLGGALSYRTQLEVCWAALVNMAALAIYFDLLSFLMGMRAYTAVSLVEVGFSVLFTVLAVVALSFEPSAVVLLSSHFAALVISIVGGVFLLHKAIEHHPHHLETVGPGDTKVATPRLTGAKGSFHKVLQFGFVSMIANMLWMVVQYVSFYLTNRSNDKEAVAIFGAFLQISPIVLFVGNFCFAVVFAHVARRWESGARSNAIFVLETSFKVVSMVMLAVTILLQATAPWWVRVLPSQFHSGLPLLGGLLMFFQAISNTALVNMIARLHERPAVNVLMAVAAGAANVVLCQWWMPQQGSVGAAWAAGVGVYAGSGLVSAVYLVVSVRKIEPGMWLVLAAPALLLLPPAIAGSIWAAVMIVAVVTPWFFNHHQKRALAFAARLYWHKLRSVLSWGLGSR